MLNTPAKLVILRLFNMTFGRIPFCSRLFRKILVLVMIKKAKKKYFASSRYFDIKDLES